MKIIELATIQDVKEHANLWNNAPNTLKRRFGKYEDVFTGPDHGTVKASDGTYWDYWQGVSGWEIHPAK